MLRLFIICVAICIIGCGNPVEPVGINIITIHGILRDHESGLFLRTDLHTTRYWKVAVEGAIITVHARDDAGIMRPAVWGPYDGGAMIFHTPSVDGSSAYRITYIKE